jgi:hypothetical protein
MLYFQHLKNCDSTEYSVLSIVSRNDEHEPETFEEVFKSLGISIERLSKDLKKAGMNLSVGEARFLVDAYYRTQEDRIRYNHQVKKLGEQEKPNDLLRWFAGQSKLLEAQITGALDVFSQSNPVGRWMRSITGIGPVIASGFLAYLDLYDRNGRIEYVGQWWRFAGMDPSVKWEKGTRRPWNTLLKTLCFKLGESFVKVKSNPNDFYGRLYDQRKNLEWEKNLAGENADAAKRVLSSKNFKKDTNAYKWYSGLINPDWARERWESDAPQKFPVAIPKKALEGKGVPMLPPAHIHAKARRWTVKLFMSHLFEVAYLHEHKELPSEPFVLSMDGHNRKIEAPAYRDFLN